MPDQFPPTTRPLPDGAQAATRLCNTLTLPQPNQNNSPTPQRGIKSSPRPDEDDSPTPRSGINRELDLDTPERPPPARHTTQSPASETTLKAEEYESDMSDTVLNDTASEEG